MKIYRWMLVILVLALGTVHAEEFTRFTVDEYEGWVEDTGTSQGRIVVYPIIAEPGTRFWGAPTLPQQGFGPATTTGMEGILPLSGLEIIHDGRLKFGYRIVTDTRYLPHNFHERIRSQTNIPLTRLSAYVLHSAPIQKYRSVELEVAGRLVARDALGDLVITGGSKEGAFYLEISKGLINSLWEGDYKLRLTTELPQAQFSSLQFSHSASAVSDSWIKAFREVTKKKRRSGFNAGFIDFSRAVQKVRVKEHIRSGSTTSIGTETDVLLRDPTPEQQERFNELFGFARIANTELLALHKASHAAALAAGSFNLADAHKAYIDALEANAPGNSDQILDKLALLSDADAMKFMTSGIKVSIGSAATSYKYDASMAARSSTDTQMRYSEYLVRNTTVLTQTYAYRQPHTNELRWHIDSAFKRIHQRMFGLPAASNPSTPQQWATAVASAINNDRRADLHYGLIDIAERNEYAGIVDYNHPVDGNGNKLLHVAVNATNAVAAELLVSSGADPDAKNAFGESPVELARRKGYASLATLLNRYRNRSGVHEIRLNHPGMDLVSARLLHPSFSGSTEVERRAPGTSVIKLTGYPHRAMGRIEFKYEFFSTRHPSAYGFPLQHQYRGNGWLIRAQNQLFVPYGMRDGETSSSSLRLTYQGEALGFAQHYDQPPNYIPPY